MFSDKSTIRDNIFGTPFKKCEIHHILRKSRSYNFYDYDSYDDFNYSQDLICISLCDEHEIHRNKILLESNGYAYDLMDTNKLLFSFKISRTYEVTYHGELRINMDCHIKYSRDYSDEEEDYIEVFQKNLAKKRTLFGEYNIVKYDEFGLENCNFVHIYL